MRSIFVLFAAAATLACGAKPPQVICDADTDCFYVPAKLASARAPALLLLHCNGARKIDLDTLKFVADSLGWIAASCHATRNHRDGGLNDKDIMRTLGKLEAKYPVDSNRVFLFGFSGQGVQALAELFQHPEKIRGVVATCPHAGAIELADWPSLEGHAAYIITREQDWNRADNEMMYRLFNESGVPCKLVTTPGEHGPGPRSEVLDGCRWLRANCP
jgi:predicted esterase